MAPLAPLVALALLDPLAGRAIRGLQVILAALAPLVPLDPLAGRAIRAQLAPLE